MPAGNVTSPRTASWSGQSRRGTSKRMENASPAAARAADCSPGSVRQRPSYCGGRPAASAAARRSSSSASVQKQR